ncbi:MAG: carbohydrate binding family 9 domain-containing protein [Flavobacterium sp.]|nr:carbohydrate binding family 9 domain-containing protein [Flavobacterium sp.]
MTRTILLLPFLLFSLFSFGQSENKSFVVKHTTAIIEPDGALDEPIWETTKSISTFNQYFPLDNVQAQNQSEIKILYDDKNLYIGIKAYSIGKNYALQSLKRDFRGSGNDSFSLLFDTYNDGTNAFLFGINPQGVLREGLISNGGTDINNLNLSWDVKWQGDSKIYDDYFTTEMIIPLTSLKFKEGATKWRFNSFRIDTQSNERSSWVRVPQNQSISNLAFMGEMVFEKPLGKSRSPLAIIPYINAISQKYFETDKGFNNLKVGGDAKVAIGNGLNLDLTLNPDFSQVEVDDQVTNLTRFEVSLPEKRQFFIDNSDLFASFGDQRDANPFFSRRIGIAKDTARNSIENKIIGGVRLSGKLTKDLRVGVLNIQTAKDEENEIPSNNNTMIALQQRVFSRSNIGVFYINRQSIGKNEFGDREDDYNRVVGLDYNLASKDNTWTGKMYAHKSFQPDDNVGNLSAGAILSYQSRKYNFDIKGISIDEDFSSDLGFIRRTGIFKGIVGAERVFWPKKGIIQNHGFRFFPILLWDPSLDFKNTDYDLMSSWKATFKDQSKFEIELTNSFTFLFDSFDPTNTDGALELPGDQGYYYNSVKFGYQSDMRKRFAFEAGSEVGQFYNGKRFSVNSMMTLRFQPKVFLSLVLNYDQITLPDPYASADIWLISPKIDVTFSKSIFWSTLIQYSNQKDNLGFNSRLQWRFAPLSDLYIVYNDNYFVNSFQPKTRSINLKLTYWLNL